MEQDAEETKLLEEHTKVEEWLTEKNVDGQREIQHSVVFYKHGANNMGKLKLVRFIYSLSSEFRSDTYHHFLLLIFSVSRKFKQITNECSMVKRHRY